MMNTKIARDRGTAYGNALRSFTTSHLTEQHHCITAIYVVSQTFGVNAKRLNVCGPTSYGMCLKGQLLIYLGFLVSTTAACITGQFFIPWALINRCMF